MVRHACCCLGLAESECPDCRGACEYAVDLDSGRLRICTRKGELVEMDDGFTVYLCAKHRSWASAMGAA